MAGHNPMSLVGWTISYASYAPPELAEISGISMHMQRVWRRRGHLPPVTTRHARFSPHEVATASIRYALAKIGIPPSLSEAIDDKATSAALYHAILGGQGSCEIIGPEDKVEELLGENDLPLMLAGDPEASNFLVWNDDGSARIVDYVEQVFDELTASIIAIDLRVIGARLMERGRKPIVTLSAHREPGAKQARRLA